MKPLNVAMIVLLVLLFAGALAGVVAGVLLHEEAGLLEDVPRWDRADFPLEVAAAGAPEPWQVQALVAAVDSTNERLGFPVLELAGEGPARVLVTFGVPAEPGWADPGANSRLERAGDRALRCGVDVINVGTLELLHLVLQHELGHCLGLAHDDFASSIMREEQRETPDGQLPPWITDHDRALLRELYAP